LEEKGEEKMEFSAVVKVLFDLPTMGPLGLTTEKLFTKEV
jgi:hypothetical protein